ncbi:MAG: DUF1207 domain-containing protein [Gemmatimonadetes bacterium]|nr:DUF1207 domain-containing protein [Gemmatimonadota bacterium]
MTYAVSAVTALLACAIGLLLLWKAADRRPARALALLLAFLAMFWGSLFRFLEVTGETDSVSISLNYGDNWVSRLAITSLLLASAAFLRFSTLFPVPLTADRLPAARRFRWLRTMRAGLLRAPVVWGVVALILLVAQILPYIVVGSLGLEEGAQPTAEQVPILAISTLGAAFIGYVVIPLVSIAVGARNLHASYRLASADDRRRMLWVVAGSTVAAALIVGAVGLAVGSSLLDSGPEPMGGAAVMVVLAPLVFVLGATIAILYTGALDPSLAVQRSTVYGVLGVLGVIAFAGIENALSSAVEQRLGLPGFVGSMAAGAIIAAVLLPFRRPIGRAVGRRFGRARALILVAGACCIAAVRPVAAQENAPPRCGAGIHTHEGTGVILLPQGALFCPLVADPKATHTFASYVRGDFATIANPTPGTRTDIAAVGLGDTFGLLRLAASGDGNGIQLDVEGAIFAQFNLDTPSFDLINADYLIGLPATLRLGGATARLRVYHQSSHLGDEFLISREPDRVNLSFESIELMLSGEAGPVRAYAGGETFFRRRPEDIAGRLVHGGIELRSGGGTGRLVAALDIKIVDDEDWKTGLAAHAGIEVARIPSPGHPPRVLSLLAQLYDGPAPYGQFYREDIRFYGVGIHFSL